MKQAYQIILLLIAASLLACTAKKNLPSNSLFTGSSAGQAFQIKIVAEGLGIPWGIDQLDNHTLFVTERHGVFSRIDIVSGEKTLITGLPPMYTHGRAGLLDIAFPPDYRFNNPEKNWVYFSYTKSQQDQGVTVLARARLQQNTLIDWQDLLISQSASNKNIHFGGRIAFDNSGHIFMTIGDRNERDQAQDLTNHIGTILRLNRDGSIPADNPFINAPAARAEIWSYGHRNPQGIAYDPKTDRLWANEHGPYGGDEINLIEAGNNYGWPIVSHGKEYSLDHAQIGEGIEKIGMAPAIKTYIPSIAPSSLLFYRGNAFPHWQGNLFSGALKLQHLNRISLDNSGSAIAEERLLRIRHERIRAISESPKGWLYLTTDNGSILQIKPQETP
jgi:glucose/arabinose dehydrogenase